MEAEKKSGKKKKIQTPECLLHSKRQPPLQTCRNVNTASREGGGMTTSKRKKRRKKGVILRHKTAQ